MEKGDLILIVGFVVLLVLFFWYIFGNSPTFEQLILGMIFINIGFTVRNHGVLQKHLGEHEGYIKGKENNLKDI